MPRVAAVRFQMAATFSTSRLTFDSGKSGAVAESIRASVASLRPSVVMSSALSIPRIDLLRPQPLVAFDQFLLEGVLLLGHRAGDDDGLAAFQAGPRQVQHLGRLHVGEGPEHLLEFRQIGEAGEPASRPQAPRRPGRFPSCRRLRRRWPPRRRNAPGHGSCSPSGSRNRCIVYISTIVLEIGVPVAKVTPWPAMLLAQVTGFHVHVEGPLAAAGLDAGDALHLGRRLQVLEIMRLVDEDVIDAEFIEHQPVILLVLGEQVLQAFASRGLLLLDGLDEVAVGTLCAGMFAQQLVVFGDLLAQELLLIVPRHADPLEAADG